MKNFIKRYFVKEEQIEPTINHHFQLGEFVRISSNEDFVRRKQDLAGGYSPVLMKPMLGKWVKVKHYQKGCVHIEFKNRNLDVHPDILIKCDEEQNQEIRQEFYLNECVLVNMDEDYVKRKQDLIGGYFPDVIKPILGKYVKVKGVQKDCIQVEFKNKIFVVQPDVLIKWNGAPQMLNVPNSDLSVISLKKEIDNQPNCIRNIEVYECDDPIFDAIGRNDMDEMYRNLHVEKKQLKDQNGRTPLNLACVMGYEEMVKELLEFEFAADVPDDMGNYPVHNCVIYGFLSILCIILEKYPDEKYRENASGLTIDQMDSYSCQFLNHIPDSHTGFSEDTIKIPDQPQSTLSSSEGDISSTIPECKICYDNIVNVVFTCGHVCCSSCADKLFKCHMCDREINNKLPIYI